MSYFVSVLNLLVAFPFQYIVFIVVGTGLLFMVIFHIGLKEPPRSCTYLFACEGSKRSAGNWIHWFKEIQFYQVCVKNKNLTLYPSTVKTVLRITNIKL